MDNQMIKADYIENFEKLGFGMFVHFGLYSVLGKGEWAEFCCNINKEKYEKLAEKFNPAESWAKDIVATAKKAGCKYITLTTRHHDGFSLYDCSEISEFNSVKTKCGRDLVAEFVSACRAEGIVPFLYHTLIDWHNEGYTDDFPAYIDYLRRSVEILCKNYGEIGGLWFDGAWDNADADWQFDKLFATIRKYQPKAMIINNQGMSFRGNVKNIEVDCDVYERGKPRPVVHEDKYRAGEMCQVLNDHWGYAKNDCNYKPVGQLINDLVDCRRFNCNFLLNVGPQANGKLKILDKGILYEIGKWIKLNKDFIYNAHGCDLKAENAEVLFDGEYYYAVIKDVPMVADSNVQLTTDDGVRTFSLPAEVKSVTWLDNGTKTKGKNGKFEVVPFRYGTSLGLRIAKFSFVRGL